MRQGDDDGQQEMVKECETVVTYFIIRERLEYSLIEFLATNNMKLTL